MLSKEAECNIRMLYSSVTVGSPLEKSGGLRRSIGRSRKLVFVIAIILLVTPFVSEIGWAQRPLPKPGVVYIPLPSETSAEKGHGSGMIIHIDLEKKEVLILTAYHNIVQKHIAGDSKKVSVQFFGDPTPFEAEVRSEWVSIGLDLALLRVKASTLPASIFSLSFGDLSRVKEGSEVIAMGHRLGDGYEQWLHDRGWIAQPIGPEIKFSSPLVDRGFSGGPLFDKDWNVIGIITDVSGKLGIAKNVNLIRDFLRGLGISPPRPTQQLGSIRIVNTRDLPECLMEMEIDLFPHNGVWRKIRWSGMVSPVQQIHLGPSTYQIRGVIRCHDSTSCEVHGRGELDLKDGAQYAVSWDQSNPGRCIGALAEWR
jgi:S1-C subfamily serine protease